MCELFGVSGKYPKEYNELLKEFFGHSNNHPNGWGLALLDGVEAEIEKEPLQASKSFYLHERLTVPVVGENILAHIRYATIGNVEYSNCHPFTGKDDSGRRWTLIHNGTIFDCDDLNHYVKKQQGETDSERIFLYLIDRVNREIEEKGELSAEDRFQLLDRLVSILAPHNKLNLLIYDGEFMYVHTNYENSLHVRKEKHAAYFSTEPLSVGYWRPLPMTTLCVYKEGDLVFTGTNHGYEFKDNATDTKYLYQIFSNL